MIDYSRIALAIDYYKSIGYEYIEVPWLVNKESINVTIPKGTRTFDTFLGSLVGSGEQSFIEVRKYLLPGRKYQCVTPCFRDDNYDDWHFPYFIKNELIIVLQKEDDYKKYLYNILNDAWKFFKKFSQASTVKTDIGEDIVIAGVEVGSYGYREYEDFRWVYGTGCAEPRTSQAVKKQGEDIEKDLQFYYKTIEKSKQTISYGHINLE